MVVARRGARMGITKSEMLRSALLKSERTTTVREVRKGRCGWFSALSAVFALSSFIRSRSRSELEVERQRIRRGVGGGHAERHRPPAAHVELHPVDHEVALGRAARDARLGRQPVTVLRHAAIHGDLLDLHRRAVRRLEVQGPAVQLALRDRVALRVDGAAITAAVAHARARVVEVLGRAGEQHAAGGEGQREGGSGGERKALEDAHWSLESEGGKAERHVLFDVAYATGPGAGFLERSGRLLERKG